MNLKYYTCLTDNINLKKCNNRSIRKNEQVHRAQDLNQKSLPIISGLTKQLSLSPNPYIYSIIKIFVQKLEHKIVSVSTNQRAVARIQNLLRDPKSKYFILIRGSTK